MNPSAEISAEEDLNPAEVGRTVNRLIEIVDTQPGADMKTSKGTWWGAFNAVTYYVDHKAGRNRDASLTSAWFGPRAALKRKALNLAVEYAEAA
jgi:hypothetical protein